MRVNRLGAVVTGAHGHAGGVQDLPDVMGVNAVDREGDDPEPSARAGPSTRAPSMAASPSSTCWVSVRSPACSRSMPRPARYSTAVRQAAAWASGWLPASKRAGPDM